MDKITVKGQYTPQYDKVNNCNIGDKLFAPGMSATTKVQEPTFLNLLNAHASSENRWFIISEHDYINFVQSRGRSIENIPADILKKLNMVGQVEIEFKRDKDIWDRIEAENINLKDQEDILESEKEFADFYAAKDHMTDEEIEIKAKDIFNKVDGEREKIRDEKNAADKKAEEEKVKHVEFVKGVYTDIINNILDKPADLTEREQQVVDEYNKLKFEDKELSVEEMEKIVEEFSQTRNTEEETTNTVVEESAEEAVITEESAEEAVITEEPAEEAAEEVTTAKAKTSKKTTAKK